MVREVDLRDEVVARDADARGENPKVQPVERRPGQVLDAAGVDGRDIVPSAQLLAVVDRDGHLHRVIRQARLPGSIAVTRSLSSTLYIQVSPFLTVEPRKGAGS